MTFPELIVELRWPLVILIFLLVSKNKIWELIPKYGHVELATDPIKLTLKRLEMEYDVSKIQIKKLHGLSGHDLWALESFIQQPDDTYKYIEHFSPQRKAIVFSFNEMGLVKILEDNGRKYVQPTTLASDVIDAAGKLFEDLPQ